MTKEHIRVEGVEGCGAYVEVFERDGRQVCRLNFFDRDTPMPRKDLLQFMRALYKAYGELVEREIEAAKLTPLMAQLFRSAAEVETWSEWKRNGINSFIDHNLRSEKP